MRQRLRSRTAGAWRGVPRLFRAPQPRLASIPSGFVIRDPGNVVRRGGPRRHVADDGMTARLTVGACMAAVVILGIFPSGLWETARKAAMSLPLN